MTIGSSAYRVYRYEGKLNLLENAALLMFASMCCICDGHGSLIDRIPHYRSQKKQDMIEYIYYQAQVGATLAQIKTQHGLSLIQYITAHDRCYLLFSSY
ncbi:hypothetical protein E2R60_07205 [Paenibacillus dendritiformis]|uniref:hypothetical protein n=1 Tax=Paenibacillus dendritiformis TaxID=130049 RepID=UPI0010593047|nr:hypothetical protein [Paenibacillus dendritiformis]TDL58230.1 hypothetical protein E2R60_07205 [Paenibacillus dendritiformis]